MMMDEGKLRETARGIRLIAMDMDGTSINSKKEFTPYTRKVMQALIDKGFLVVPATGRAYYRLNEKMLKLNNVRYIISADGAFVTECATGRHLWEQLIPCSVAAKMMAEFLVDGNCTYVQRNDIECSHVMGCTSRDLYRRIFMQPDFPKPEEIMTAGLEQQVIKEGKDISKIGLFFTREDGFAYYEPLVSEKFPEVNYFRSDKTELEFTSRYTSKGRALRALAEFLEIPREQICAIGDNGNDTDMLEYAGLSIAMGNAVEILRKRADYIAATNDEEGAAQFFEDFFLS